MHYRAYFIDDNEHVRGAFDIRARNDAEAIEKSERFRERFAIEVWELNDGAPDQPRLLRRFERAEERSWAEPARAAGRASRGPDPAS